MSHPQKPLLLGHQYRSRSPPTHPLNPQTGQTLARSRVEGSGTFVKERPHIHRGRTHKPNAIPGPGKNNSAPFVGSFSRLPRPSGPA